VLPEVIAIYTAYLLIVLHSYQGGRGGNYGGNGGGNNYQQRSGGNSYQGGGGTPAPQNDAVDFDDFIM
jgi:hypothetical protein